MRWATTLGIASLLVACSSASAEKHRAPDLSPLGGDRPVTPIVPDDFDPDEPTPLLIMLHGYGVSGLAEDILLKLDKLVNERGFIYLRPDGTFDSMNHRFWNATDACCNFDKLDIDDVGYVQSLIDEVKQRYSVSHVAIMGHSNGGFMAHRFACDRASSIDAFASLAGMTWLDPSKCSPDAPLRALQIHGTADPTVHYDGGIVQYGDAPYPSAPESAARWGGYDGCDPTPISDGNRDYSSLVPGAETTVTHYTGCKSGSAAELWSLEGENHLPSINDAWRKDMLDFLLK